MVDDHRRRPADRHPRQGHRQVHLRAEHARARDAARPDRPAARPGRLPVQLDVPVSVDASSIAHIPGAKVVQVGNFLGVVAPQEYDAIQAAAQLKVVWNQTRSCPATGNLWSTTAHSTRPVRSRPSTRRTSATSTARSQRRRRRSARPSSTTTRATRRSAPAAPSPTSRRAARRSTATPRTSRAS